MLIFGNFSGALTSFCPILRIQINIARGNDEKKEGSCAAVAAQRKFLVSVQNISTNSHFNRLKFSK